MLGRALDSAVESCYHAVHDRTFHYAGLRAISHGVVRGDPLTILSPKLRGNRQTITHEIILAIANQRFIVEPDRSVGRPRAGTNMSGSCLVATSSQFGFPFRSEIHLRERESPKGKRKGSRTTRNDRGREQYGTGLCLSQDIRCLPKETQRVNGFVLR